MDQGFGIRVEEVWDQGSSEIRAWLTGCRDGDGTGESLLAEQHDARLAAALTAALTELMGSNGITQDVGRANLMRFKSNLQAFVVNAKSIVRRK